MEIIIPSSFVKAGINVKDGDVVELLTEGEWKEIKGMDGKPKKVLQFEMKLANREVRTYTMNNTTMKGLVEELGSNSKKWVKVPLRANVVKIQAFGKLTDLLTLSAKEKTAQEEEEAIPVLEEEEEIDVSKIPF